MRIISGKYKGKNINFIKNSTTRPLKDSVKENIFNILVHSPKVKIKIENSSVLDLYSGIGSFGLECISRGARKITFVEENKDALKLLKNNLSKLSNLDNIELINSNIEKYLDQNLIEKYEIFFLDPPFSDKLFLKNLERIKKNKLYVNNHIVVLHRERKSDDNLADVLKVFEVKFYGKSKIIFGYFT
tara:strand:+ start:5821 stop:6381 length:561 start_codon:yes stop_codon:yes gene_type:complete